eukprot:955409-Amphidinium_carterae.1
MPPLAPPAKIEVGFGGLSGGLGPPGCSMFVQSCRCKSCVTMSITSTLWELWVTTKIVHCSALFKVATMYR